MNYCQCLYRKAPRPLSHSRSVAAAFVAANFRRAGKLTFCPHCGLNLTVRQCPACSTELDVNWRFCVTCGRGADVPELPVSVARMSM